MKTIALRQCALSFGVAVASLAGCGGSQPPIGTTGAMAQQGIAQRRPAYDICSPQAGFVFPGVAIRSRGIQRGASTGLSPADIQAAYSLPSSYKGTGQVVAVVDFCDDPNAAADLATYRSQFSLPAATFYKFNQYGAQSDYPPSRTATALQEDLDIEMVSASCPNCTIYLIEANGEDGPDLQTAEATAVSLGARIVSNSWGCGPKPGASCVDKKYFDTKGVTYIGLGSVGGWGYESYPADFDSVVAVGGTYLTQGGGGKRGWTEAVFPRYGGGCFTDDPKPPWQHHTACSGREANDVSIVAANVAAYDSYGFYGGWFRVTGTGVPQGLIAGIFGLAGNATEQDGGRTFWVKSHLKHLYKVACGGSCVKGRYSYPDGWGSPHGIGAF